ncbi:MAG: hypothetical protein L3K16_04945 [Thermoplasmata archaeon]|nr:hypothetical protein [Thermoplasmata archaeon]
MVNDAPTSVAQFDLRGYSESNYQRNRRPRVIALTIAIGVILAFLTMFATVLATGLDHPWEFGAALIIVVGGTPTVYLAFAMPFAYYKWYLRPPVGLTITPDTIVFEAISGGAISFRASEPGLRIGLSVLSDLAGAPPESRVLLVARHGEGDTALVWRRLLPFTYLPTGAVPAVLAWARRAGLEIYETPGSITYPRTEPDRRTYRLTHPGAP